MNRRDLLKLFSFVPALAVSTDITGAPVEPVAPLLPQYDGPPRIIGFKALGVGTSARHALAGIRRPDSEYSLIAFNLAVAGGHVEWTPYHYEQFVVPDGKVIVYSTDVDVRAYALLQSSRGLEVLESLRIQNACEKA